MAFNIVAQLQLRAGNVGQVVKEIQDRITGIHAKVDVRVSRAASANLTRLEAKLQSVNKILVQINTNVSTLSAGFTHIGSILSGVNTQVSNLNKGLTTTPNRLNKATLSTKTAANAFESFGKGAALAAKRYTAFAVAAGAGLGIVTAITSGFREALRFQKELVKLSQVTGTSVAGIRDLEAEVTRLSVTFGVSSSELIQVSQILAQAGLSANETKRAMEALAKTTLTPTFDDITETVEGAISIMSQFDVTVDELNSTFSSINTVAARYAVESADIITAVRRSGAAFKAAGADLDEFIALFSSVRATTRESAETISTGLRTIATRIQRPQTIEFLKQLGVNLQDTEGKFIGVYDAVGQLSSALKDVDPRDSRFAQIIEELGGFRQVGKTIPLLQQFDKAQEILRVARSSANSLDKDAQTSGQALIVQFTRVQERFLAMIRTISETGSFNVLAGGLLKLADAAIRVVDVLGPVLPILATIQTIKAAKGLGAFATGFIGEFKSGGGAGAAGTNIAASVTGGTNAAQKALANAPTATQASTQISLLQNISNTIQQSNNLLANIAVGVSTSRNLSGVSRTGKGFTNPIKRARGGLVPGVGSGDTVPAMLEPGEFVIRKKAVESLGIGQLANINARADGGEILDAVAGRGTSVDEIAAYLQRPKAYAQALISSRKTLGSFTLGQINTLLSKKKIEEATGISKAEFDSKKGSYTSNDWLSIIGSVTSRGGLITKTQVANAANKQRIANIEANTLGIDGNFGVFSPTATSIGRRVLAFGEKSKMLSDPRIQKLAKANGINDLKRLKVFYDQFALTPASNELFDTNIRNKFDSLYSNLVPNGSALTTKSLLGPQYGAVLGNLFEGYIRSVIGSISSNNSLFDFSKIDSSPAWRTLLGDQLEKAVATPYIEAKSSDSKDQVADAFRKALQVATGTGQAKKFKDASIFRAFSLRPKRKALGGTSGSTDTVPALLTPGEFVINKDSAQSIGYDTLSRINKVGRYQTGGLVKKNIRGSLGLPTSATNDFETLGLTSGASPKLIQDQYKLVIAELKKMANGGSAAHMIAVQELLTDLSKSFTNITQGPSTFSGGATAGTLSDSTFTRALAGTVADKGGRSAALSANEVAVKSLTEAFKKLDSTSQVALLESVESFRGAAKDASQFGSVLEKIKFRALTDSRLVGKDLGTADTSTPQAFGPPAPFGPDTPDNSFFGNQRRAARGVSGRGIRARAALRRFGIRGLGGLSAASGGLNQVVNSNAFQTAVIGGVGLGGAAFGTPESNGSIGVAGQAVTGAVGGLATGAALGSFLPGFGTAIGAATGAIVGFSASLLDAQARLRDVNFARAIEGLAEALKKENGTNSNAQFDTARAALNTQVAGLSNIDKDIFRLDKFTNKFAVTFGTNPFSNQNFEGQFTNDIRKGEEKTRREAIKPLENILVDQLGRDFSNNNSAGVAVGSERLRTLFTDAGFTKSEIEKKISEVVDPLRQSKVFDLFREKIAINIEALTSLSETVEVANAGFAKTDERITDLLSLARGGQAGVGGATSSALLRTPIASQFGSFREELARVAGQAGPLGGQVQSAGLIAGALKAIAPKLARDFQTVGDTVLDSDPTALKDRAREGIFGFLNEQGVKTDRVLSSQIVDSLLSGFDQANVKQFVGSKSLTEQTDAIVGESKRILDTIAESAEAIDKANLEYAQRLRAVTEATAAFRDSLLKTQVDTLFTTVDDAVNSGKNVDVGGLVANINKIFGDRLGGSVQQTVTRLQQLAAAGDINSEEFFTLNTLLSQSGDILRQHADSLRKSKELIDKEYNARLSLAEKLTSGDSSTRRQTERDIQDVLAIQQGRLSVGALDGKRIGELRSFSEQIPNAGGLTKRLGDSLIQRADLESGGLLSRTFGAFGGQTNSSLFGQRDALQKGIQGSNAEAARADFASLGFRGQALGEARASIDDRQAATSQIIAQELQARLNNLQLNTAVLNAQVVNINTPSVPSAPKLPGFAFGGRVGTDTVPAMLTPGEFVVRKSAVDRIGIANLNNMNGGIRGYANGGLVTPGGIDAISKLASAFASIPNNIEISGNHKVEVIINGAEVLTAIQPAIQKIAGEAVNAAVKDLTFTIKRAIPNFPI